MKIKLFTLLIGLLHFSAVAQCDLSINSWDPVSGDIIVDVINSENCGCNEFTTVDNTCENSGSPSVNDNSTVSHIVLGLHLDGYDYNWGCTTASNHPGWTFKAFTLYGNQLLDSGDQWSANIYETGTASNDCWAEILANDTACAELVIWQINLSQTSIADVGGWAVNPNTGNQTQNYPDVNIFNNSISSCPPPDAPDAVIGNVEFETGCIGDDAYYEVTYIIWNYGQDTITDYCVEIWNEDIYDCYDSDSSGGGNLNIPPGFGQSFTSGPFQGPWFGGGFFVIEVSDVNDEIITANNITTVFYPELLECPIECESDTIIEYVDVIDTLFIDVLIYITDTLYVELPNDTIFIEEYVYITDTIIEFEYIYITDTIIEYVDVYITDTIIEYIYDTTYVDVIIDNYIYLTDTIVQTEFVDCESGLPCSEEPPGMDCPDWTSIYIPNTFTPNNDGTNDVWQIVYNLNCWYDVEFKIFNRWGEMVFEGFGNDFDSYPYWDGSYQGGNHYVSDGVYVYTLTAKREDPIELVEESGSITIFR